MLIHVIATIGEFCTRATAAAFEKSEKPLYSEIETLSARSNKTKQPLRVCTRDAVQSHFRESPHSDSRACESKTAPPSKMAGQNDVMKNPEKRVSPQAAGASRKRATAKTEISGADSPGT
jgi:hypothetical protein